MLTISDFHHLRTQIHETLKTISRVDFARKAGVNYSTLDKFLDGHAISYPTYRKLRSALALDKQLSISSVVDELRVLIQSKEEILKQLINRQRVERTRLENEIRVLRMAMKQNSRLPHTSC